MQQKTIKRPIRYRGFGILFGKESRITLRPAPPDTGIIFNENIKVKVKNGFVRGLVLGLRSGKTKIYFVEHLLAACYGLGINNLFIEVSGKEIPFADGSSLPFVRLINRAGIRSYQARPKIQNLKTPIIVSKNDSFILALPAKLLSIDCFVDFPQSKIGAQFWADLINQPNFVKELASARTFGYYRNYRLLAKVLPFEIKSEEGLIVPKILRYRNEAVRHKVLDLVGHFALLGRNLNAKIFAYKSSHKLNHRFVRKLEAL
ncbi:MAG: UDP-3-O-acyl-N-acetylglucosamine deacetylase [bacterium]